MSRRPSPARRLLRITAAAGLAAAMTVVALMAGARPAAAHADFVAASPAPGTGVPQAPGEVVIRFTEPLNRQLSRIEVLDEEGTDVGEGTTLPVEGDRQAMRRKLGLLPVGRYTVRWTTVSPLDGHTLKGSYRFAVGTSTTGDQTVRADPISSEGWGGLLGRFAALGGLVLWAGSAALGARAGQAGVAAGRLRLLRRVGPPAALLGTATAAASAAMVATGSPMRIGAVLLGGWSGWLRLAVLGLATAGIVHGGSSRRGDRLLVGGAVVAEAAAGHAATAPVPALAAASFAVHLAAVGVWVFAITAAVAAGRRVAGALRALSPPAVGAAVVVAATGAINAFVGLHEPGELATTGYGRTVALKAVLFAAMAGLGATHLVRRRRAGVAAAALRRPLRMEWVAAVAALAAATALVGFPDSPRDLAEAAAERRSPLEELASGPAVSMAEESGPFVVGLTVSPPRPGPVQIQVDVLGVEPGDAVREGRVEGRGPADARFVVPLTGCGFGCLQGRGVVTRPGRWDLSTTIASNRGTISSNTVVPLPTRGGDGVLDRALETMGRLHSARMRETLQAAEGEPPLVTDYVYAAPGAMRYDIGNGASVVVVGDDRYTRDRPGGPWERGSWAPPGFRWPGSSYRDFWGGSSAVRVVADEQIDGVATEVVAFVRPDIRAWFRLWVDADGLARRMEMRAEGHIMDQRYVGFDVPVTIEPPATARSMPGLPYSDGA